MSRQSDNRAAGFTNLLHHFWNLVPSSSWRWWSLQSWPWETSRNVDDDDECLKAKVIRFFFLLAADLDRKNYSTRYRRLSGPRHRVILDIDGKSTVKQARNGIIFRENHFSSCNPLLRKVAAYNAHTHTHAGRLGGEGGWRGLLNAGLQRACHGSINPAHGTR